GLDEYLTKPLRPSELQAALRGAALHLRGLPNSSTPTVASGPRAAAPAANREEELVLDPTAFDEAREFLGEEADSVIGGLIESFQRRTPEMLAELRSAVANGDGAAVRLVAHTLKGFAGTVGARRIQTLCPSLEKSAENAPPEEVLRLID